MEFDINYVRSLSDESQSILSAAIMSTNFEFVCDKLSSEEEDFLESQGIELEWMEDKEMGTGGYYDCFCWA